MPPRLGGEPTVRGGEREERARDDQRMPGPTPMDLFASRLSSKLPQYVSWRPDPAAMACNAFSLDWSQWKGNVNPPWNLIGKVLAQVRSQRAQLVLINPLWSAQLWYPALLNMAIQIPILLPNIYEDSISTNTLVQPAGHLPRSIRVDYLRDRYRSQRLSGEASELLLVSWR